MIVVVDMKNVILRGKTYYFRIVVPADCREELGCREVVESLGTKNPLVADERVVPLRKKWKAAFKTIRSPSTTSTSSDIACTNTHDESIDYYQVYRDLMEKNLPVLIDCSSEEELRSIAVDYREYIAYIQQDSSVIAPRHLDIPELEQEGLLPRKDPEEKTGALAKVISSNWAF